MRKKDYSVRELKIIHRRLVVAMKGIEEGIPLMEELNTPSVYIDESPANRIVTWSNQLVAKSAMDTIEQHDDDPDRPRTRKKRKVS